MDEHAVPASQNEPDPPRDAVADRECLQIEIADTEAAGPVHAHESRHAVQAVFGEAVSQETKRQRGSVDGEVDLLQQERDRPDVVLVPMREKKCPETVGDLLETAEIGDDKIDSQHRVVGKHQARIHEDGGLPVVEQ